MLLALSPLDAQLAYCGHSVPIITGSYGGAEGPPCPQTAQGVTVFDHVEIQVVRFDDCRRFYATVLAPLLIELKWADEEAAGFGLMGRDKVGFLIARGEQGPPCHLAFRASDAAQVDGFHHAGIRAGFVCNGPPGLRPHYAPDYYAAFLRDPDGNNIEALAYLERPDIVGT